MRRLVVVAALAVCAAGCGQSTAVSPVDAAQNYVNAIATGYYPGACALLDGGTRHAMLASTGSRIGCSALLARCLPVRTQQSSDQSQLLYVNTEFSVHGRRAQVTVSGLPVARAIRRVTLADERTRWLLTSPGVAVTRCAHRLRANARRRARRARHAHR